MELVPAKQRFLAAAREGELVVLEDAGHLANLSRPKRFTRVLRRAARDRTAADARRPLSSEGPGPGADAAR